MSDEEESNINSEQEQQDDEENSQQDQEPSQEDDQQDSNQDDDQQSGDDDNEDEDEEDKSGSDQNSNDSDQKSKQQYSNDDNQKKLPTFKMLSKEQPEEFKFTSLLSEISSLSSSVDNFIGTLHSSSSTSYRRPYNNNYIPQQVSYQPHISQTQIPQVPVKPKVVMMKDQDTQVDMKPQIIIQPTRSAKQDPIIQAKPYKIATESQKFLAQLYEENKKLKRWQMNPNQSSSSYMASFGGSNGFSGSGKGFYGSKEKFERKQYEKGLFDVQERNKEIDEAIMMLRREEQNYF